MLTVNVILPLPLEGTFTYSVPKDMESQVEVGKRVRVPLGRSKTYTAIIDSVVSPPDLPLQGREIVGGRHQLEVSPSPKGGGREGGSLKDLLEVLDAKPMLTAIQMRLWHWMAEYYMCPLGDIYKAALPSGLKQEEDYKPKTEVYIRLTKAYQSEAAMHIALNMLSRAPMQEKAFCTYLELSHWDEVDFNFLGVQGVQEVQGVQDDTLDSNSSLPLGGVGGGLREVTREELINVSHCQTSHVKALCDRGILETYKVEVGRLNTTGQPHPENIKPLSPAQQQALSQLSSLPREGQGGALSPSPSGEGQGGAQLSTFNFQLSTLLWGVTGSGKTEIYIHLIQKTLDEGKQVLYLLPEIALTVQIMKRLHNVFGDRLGIYHSRYSDAERVEIWQKQLSDHPYDVILGARSAVFLPMTNLGLIIIDEEHEQSFKQQDPAPRYHARSVALMLSRFTGAQVVMGTATPSIETFHNAMTGKYRLVTLTERYKGMQLPEIKVVDIKEAQRKKLMQGPFSPTLLKAIKEAIDNNRQVILFLNRRGWAPVVECHDCGWTPKCQNCDVSLTMHRTSSQLTCHYCGYTYQIPQKCPNCFCTDIRVHGYGTEKIEESLLNILSPSPSGEGRGGAYLSTFNFQLSTLKISRMDLDTTRTKNAYERIIDDFSHGVTNVLIGTQMVTKGLDFERVSVVGILNADSLLNAPDFRAYEHAYQMMAQVAGRAGRKGQRGTVILQTRQPEVPVIGQVVRNDYRAFYNSVCQERQLFSYPPYTRLINIYLRHQKAPIVDAAAIEMGSRLRQYFGTRVLGPDKPSVARVKTLCIRKIILKLEQGIALPKVRQYLRLVRNEILKDKRHGSLQILFDVDPL